MNQEQDGPTNAQALRQLEQLELRTQDSAENCLALEVTLESLLSAVRKASKHEDREIQIIQDAVEEFAAKGLTPSIACAKGCWHCCTQIVGATIPEILRIADYILKNWTAEERSKLKGRISSFEKASEPFLKGETNIAPRHACPLLQDLACSIWAERPLVCRGFNSTDVNACIQKREDPISTINIPQMPAQYYASIYVRTGLRKSLKKFHLNAGLYDLVRGLKIALENEDAAERYLAGDNPFKDAELPSKTVEG